MSNGGAALARYTPINPSFREILAKAANFVTYPMSFTVTVKRPCPLMLWQKPQTTG